MCSIRVKFIVFFQLRHWQGLGFWFLPASDPLFCTLPAPLLLLLLLPIGRRDAPLLGGTSQLWAGREPRQNPERTPCSSSQISLQPPPHTLGQREWKIKWKAQCEPRSHSHWRENPQQTSFFTGELTCKSLLTAVANICTCFGWRWRWSIFWYFPFTLTVIRSSLFLLTS